VERVTAASTIPKALRLRATLAAGLGEHDAARLLRGYADALGKDMGALSRIRERITESAALVDEAPVTAIVQVWRDALTDLGSGARPAKTSARRAPVIVADTEALDELRTELAEMREAMASMEERLIARLATLEAVPAPPPTVPLALPAPLERLRAYRLPDGRTWLELVESIADEHGVSAADIASRRKLDAIAFARQHVWWYLYRKAGASYSTTYIGEVFDRDHNTVLPGIASYERRRADPPAPPSGPRLRPPRVAIGAAGR
jgi:hypothetical protein